MTPLVPPIAAIETNGEERMTSPRKDLPPLPKRFLSLPVDDRGYPVPWFVAEIDGKPDFRVVRPGGLVEALERRKCWLCGQRLGRYGAFVIGPMCAINRISSEPPSHRECAEFAVKACPFLVRPGAKRRDANLPDSTQDPAGIMIPRNPGIALLWVSRNWRPVRAPNGLLIDVGDPSTVSWWREGRAATRTEIMDSIEAGCPTLIEMAEKEGPGAVVDLARKREVAMELLPAA